jgi:tetratricopeptide (TPR) repeat protein
MAQKFEKAKVALLWSCYSASGNSWGDSPAMCLHRLGSTFVLSFQAELHNLDAQSISSDLYRGVFGPMPSRDLESTLVRIRAARFRDQFENANWASITLYLRNPIDLSALPLNGPRVPAECWSEEALDNHWDEVVKTVARLKPGDRLSLEGAPQPDKLPEGPFRTWKGTVIRLDGGQDPLSKSTLKQLDLDPDQAPKTHPADCLTWFFDKVARYGAPLIVWSNSAPRHLKFLELIAPSNTLTFLLLYGPPDIRGVVELVNDNRLAEARTVSAGLTEESGDECWQAAYMAYARSENETEALRCINALKSESERMLLSGNFVSRFGLDPRDPGRRLAGLERRQVEEAYYQAATSISDKNDRDIGRARLELGYLLQSQGEFAAAEHIYRDATENLERATQRDTRWHIALGRVLRDRADLLARQRSRLAEALALLQRALAIHSYHGRELQVAYSNVTAARIALAAGRHSDAIEHALDAANIFEGCDTWRGWSEPVLILLDALAETRQTDRMIAISDLAIAKVGNSNLAEELQKMAQARLRFKKAQAFWIAGKLDAASDQLKALDDVQDSSLRREIDRLRVFLDR